MIIYLSTNRHHYDYTSTLRNLGLHVFFNFFILFLNFTLFRFVSTFWLDFTQYALCSRLFSCMPYGILTQRTDKTKNVRCSKLSCRREPERCTLSVSQCVYTSIVKIFGIRAKTN